MTAAVLAYELLDLMEKLGNEELNVLMEEISIISKKVGKDESEILKIIKIYSENSVSFYEFVEDINKNYSKEEKTFTFKICLGNSFCRWSTRC